MNIHRVIHVDRVQLITADSRFAWVDTGGVPLRIDIPLIKRIICSNKINEQMIESTIHVGIKIYLGGEIL